MYIYLHIRRGDLISWNYSYRWSWAPIWVLEIKPLKEQPVLLTEERSLQLNILKIRNRYSKKITTNQTKPTTNPNLPHKKHSNEIWGVKVGGKLAPNQNNLKHFILIHSIPQT